MVKDIDPIEAQISRLIIDGEYETAKRNKVGDINDFEASIDMLEGIRAEKDYDYQSDISLNEFASTELAQDATDASQYFQTRDFAEVYLEDEGDEAIAKANAAKECINRTLNQKHLYYYQKFMRARITNNLGGYVYARCWWEQGTKPVQIMRPVIEELDVDGFGNQIVDLEIQVPARRTREVPETIERVVVDRFNFDPIDSRNVFTDNSYVYSVQQKKWIIVRFEKTFQELKIDAVNMGYFNLDKLDNMRPPLETATSKESYNKDIKHQKVPHDKDKPYDIAERHGLFWVRVKAGEVVLTKEGRPEPGINDFGEPLEYAELREMIITHAISDSSKVLIRFQLQPYKDANGKPFKPIVRGLCYVHPTKDTGLGDGKYSRELQIAIDDTFNLGNDRVRFATMPVLKGRKFQLEDNSTIYMEPGHLMELENPDDIQEIKIDDNITGALQQIAMLTGKLHQVRSIYPTTMGSLPSIASTTATAIGGAESRSNTRANYKSLTFEHTFLTEFYWMIQQMTWQFAKPETGFKLMGEKVFDFDPSADYYYKPLSQSIEAEHSRIQKKRDIIQMVGYVAQIPNPKTAKLINLLLAKFFELSGDEFVNFGKALLDESVPVEGKAGSVADQGQAVSNQNRVAMSGLEETTRSAVSG